jgi:hypothetical protein
MREMAQGESLGCTYIKKDTMYCVMRPNYQNSGASAHKDSFNTSEIWGIRKSTVFGWVLVTLQ